MAVERFLDSFNVTTSAAGTTIARSGYGFAPKAFIIWSTGRTTSTDAVSVATMNTSIGFGVSPTSRRAIASQSVNASANAAADKYHTEDACFLRLSTTGAIQGALDVDSFDSDGITFIVDTQFGSNTRVFVLALGGADITDAAIITHVQPTAGSVPFTEDVTSIGFQPDTIITLSAYISTAPPGVLAGGGGGMAFTAGATPASVNWGARSLDGGTTMNTYSVCKNGETIAAPDFQTSGAVMPRGTITSWLSNGFQWTWNEIDTNARRFFHLAIKGGSYKVGSVLSLTNTTNDINSGSLGFSPKGAMLVSAMKAETGSDTTHDDNALSLGAFTSTSSRGAAAHFDDDQIGTSVVGSAIEFDSVYIHMPNAANAVDGLADIQAINADDFDLRMTEADPSQSFIAFWTFGDAAAGGETGDVSDGGVFGDSISAVSSSVAALSDGLSAGDSSSALAGALGLLSDGISQGDSSDALATALGEISDGIEGGDESSYPAASALIDADYNVGLVRTPIPDYFFTTNSSVNVGTQDSGGSGPVVQRGIIRYPLTVVPSGATITKAEVRVTEEQHFNYEDRTTYYGPLDGDGQYDPEDDEGVDGPGLFSRSTLTSTNYLTTNVHQSTGSKSVDLGATAYADIAAAKVAVDRFTVVLTSVDETTDAVKYFKFFGVAQTPTPPDHIPQLYLEWTVGAPANEVEVSDGGSFGDSISALATTIAAITEGLVGGDAQSALAAALAQLEDGLAGGEDQPALAGALAALLEGASLGDLVSSANVIAVAIEDGLAAGDTWAAQAAGLAELLDGGSYGDLASALAATFAALADAVAAGDSSSALAAASALLGEGTSLGDSVSGELEGNQSGNTSDASLLGDASSALAAAQGSQLDGGLLGDTQEGQAATTAVQVDGGVLGDASTGQASAQGSMTDTMVWSDALQALAAASASLVEGARFGESLEAVRTLVALLAGDEVRLGDTWVGAASLAATLSDGTRLGDSILARAVALGTMTDALVLSDEIVYLTASVLFSGSVRTKRIAAGSPQTPALVRAGILGARSEE